METSELLTCWTGKWKSTLCVFNVLFPPSKEAVFIAILQMKKPGH